MSTLNIIRKVLKEIGPDCHGVMYSIDELTLSGITYQTIFLRMNMEDKQREHTLDILRKVLEEIGPDCHGVMYSIAEITISGIAYPAIFLRWSPNIHPKTKFDPSQCIVLESGCNGKMLKDDTIRKILRETIESMIKVDKHANKVFYNPDSLSVKEGRDTILAELEKTLN